MSQALPQTLARAWVTMARHMRRRWSVLLPPKKAPSQEPRKMATSRTTQTMHAAHSVASSGACHARASI